MNNKHIRVHFWELMSCGDFFNKSMAIEVIGKGYFNPNKKKIEENYGNCWFPYSNLGDVIETLKNAKMCQCGNYIFRR